VQKLRLTRYQLSLLMLLMLVIIVMLMLLVIIIKLMFADYSCLVDAFVFSW
jgi:hypothetical protein